MPVLPPPARVGRLPSAGGVNENAHVDRTTRLRFPLAEPEVGLDLRQLAAAFQALDTAYRKSYALSGRSGRAPRPQVRVSSGSIVIDLLQGAWDVVEAVDVLVGVAMAVAPHRDRLLQRRRSKTQDQLVHDIALQLLEEVARRSLVEPSRDSVLDRRALEEHIALVEAVADLTRRLGVPEVEHLD